MIKYRIGHPKMTSKDGMKLRRAIKAQLYTLQKYASWFPWERQARIKRMLLLGENYVELYRRTGSTTARQSAVRIVRQGLSLRNLGLRSAKYLRLYMKLMVAFDQPRKR